VVLLYKNEENHLSVSHPTLLVALTRQKFYEAALVRVCVVFKVLVLNNTVMNIGHKFPNLLSPPRDQGHVRTMFFNILVLSKGFPWE